MTAIYQRYQKFEYSIRETFKVNCCNTNGAAQQNFDRFIYYKVMSRFTAFLCL